MAGSIVPFLQAESINKAASSLFGFIGPGYLSESQSVDGERCINLYTEAVGADGGRSRGGSPYILVGTPGKTLVTSLPDPQIRTLFYSNDRCFAVASGNFYELFYNPILPIGSQITYLFRGPLNIDGPPASIASNGLQLCIMSGGQGFIYDLNMNTLNPIVQSNWANATVVTFIDDYFVTFSNGDRKFWISALQDGTSWNGLDFGIKEGSPDSLVSVLADHEELWLFGSQKTEVWYDTGSNNFPFQRIQGALIEQGCAAQFSPVQLDNSIFWLGADQRGQGICWRANGYIPVRVSNHAVEYEWSQYPLISDAIAWAYQESGHTFYVIWFPSANKMWCYDVATQHWHERGTWNQAHGHYDADHIRCHCVAWNGMHLVGDKENGNIYQQSLAIYTDVGQSQSIAATVQGPTTIFTVPNGTLFAVNSTVSLSGINQLGWNGNYTVISNTAPFAIMGNPPTTVSTVTITLNSTSLQAITGGMPTISQNQNIRRLRSAPHINTGFKLNFFPRLILDMQFGVQPNIESVFTSPILTGTLAQQAVLTIASDTLPTPDPGNLARYGAANIGGVIISGVSQAGWNGHWDVITAKNISPGRSTVTLSLNSLGMSIPTGGTMTFTHARVPVVNLRKSDDGGFKFGSYIIRSASPTGKYQWRVRWDRLGSARDRVYEVTSNEPMQQIWIDAYAEVEPGRGG